MKGYSLRRFIAVALISVILLSIGWDSVGKSYNALLVFTLSSFLPEGAQVQAQGHEIRMIVRREGPPDRTRLERDGRGIVGAQANVDSPIPAAQDARLIKPPNISPTIYSQNLEGRVSYYALIPALALILAVPAITLRVRASCLVAALSLGFCGHLVGMYLIAQKFIWWVNHVAAATDIGHANLDTVILPPFYVFLFFSPLSVWIPLMFFWWRSDSPPESS